MEISLENTDEKKQSDLTKYLDWFGEWEDATSDARAKAERDHDYYDGKQWTEDEIAELNKRGQPVVVINRIAHKINFVIGHEIKTRTDPVALPRNPTHEESATVATDALRYVCDSEDMSKKKTQVAQDVFIEGYGGVVVEVEPVQNKEFQRIDVKIRKAPWDRTFYDSHSREFDYSDAKYLGLVTWMDYEDAVPKYKDKENILEAAKSSGNDSTTDDRPKTWYDRKRKRVKIVEMYTREGKDWTVCHFTQAGFLIEPQPTGYLDEDGNHVCPLILTSCFIDRDNNRYGIVRNMISPQEEINKRRSKALNLISLRQVIYEQGAVENITTAQQELAKPDGAVEIRPNSRFDVSNTQDMAMAQFNLLAESKAEIDNTGPMSAMAESQVGSSGRAMLVKQQSAATELEPVFDNLRKWQQNVYRAIWQRIRQFWKEERWMRVRDDEERKGFRFISVNQPTTKAQRLQEMIQKKVPISEAVQQVDAVNAGRFMQMAVQQATQQIQQIAQQTGQQIPPEQIEQQALQTLMQQPFMQEMFINNSVDRLDVDIVLDEAPDTAIVAQEEFERLAALAQSGLPIPPDVLIEASQLRNKKKLLEMLSPKDQSQAPQMQAQMAMLQAQLRKVTADAGKSEAETQKIQAEIPSIASGAKLDESLAVKHAAEVGQMIAQPQNS